MVASLPALILLLILGDDTTAAEPAPRTYRMVDVDGDGRLDRLQVDAEGRITIAINRGARQFEPVPQELPRVALNDVLAEDLNGDGHTDLYLVSPGANAAWANPLSS